MTGSDRTNRTNQYSTDSILRSRILNWFNNNSHLYTGAGGDINAINQFLLDGVLTTVTEDTVTPANNTPLPVKLVDLTGDLNITAGDLNVQLTDVGANYDSARIGDGTNLLAVNADGSINVSGGGASLPPATHRSPYDFTAAYTSNITITLTGNPTITDASQIAFIKQIKADNTSALFINGDGTTTITHSAGVLTIYGSGTPFVTGDVYEIGLNFAERAYDASSDVLKVIVQNPLTDQYTDAELLVSGSDIGAVDDTWIDQGAEIDVRGYKSIVVWADFTVNNSTGNQIQLLVKHEFGGTDEYVLDSTSDYQKTIGDSSIKVAYLFPCEGVPYVQLQSKATVIGATEGTFNINITKEW